MNLTIQEEENTDSTCSSGEDGRKHPDTKNLKGVVFARYFQMKSFTHGITQRSSQMIFVYSVFITYIFVLIKATSSNNINFNKYRKNV